MLSCMEDAAEPFQKAVESPVCKEKQDSASSHLGGEGSPASQEMPAEPGWQNSLLRRE